MSNASRIWIAAGELWPPFCNQMIVEGTGSIDIGQLKNAVELASVVNPGARIVRKSLLSSGRWADSGITPPVREVDGTGWSGNDPANASFLTDKLDIDNGPSCEVLLIHGTPQRLAFRTHHAVMDGRGTITWAEDVFRILRGENPIGSDYLAVEDQFLNLSSKIEKPVDGNYISPAGNAGKAAGFIWSRRKIEGKFSSLLPEIICITAMEAWKYREGNVRIGVPVDLRTRRPGFRSTSNLTNAIFFNISRETTPQQLSGEIKTRLKEKKDGTLTWEDSIIKFIPSFVLKKILYKESMSSRKTGHYRYSAIISNLGNIPLNLFSTEDFTARSAFFIPPGNELTPFFMTIQGTGTFIEVILTLPACYGDTGRIDILLDNITSKLKKSSVTADA